MVRIKDKRKRVNNIKQFFYYLKTQKKKVIKSYVINYLSKIPKIHISQYTQSFPSRLTILFPRVKDHLTKVSTPGIGSRLFFFL